MPQVSQSPPPQTASSSKSSPILKLVLLGVGVIVAGSAIQFFLQQQRYNQGLQAYEAGDCKAAIAAFNQVTDGARLVDMSDMAAKAMVKRAECQALETAVAQQQAKQFAPALVAYRQFSDRYSDSPLMDRVRQQSKSLIQQASPKALAKPEVCGNLKSMQTSRLIAQTDKLPLLYNACGNLYAGMKNYPKAIAQYEQFLAEYPNHKLVPNVQTALAKSIVADAKAKGSGNILQPERSGSTSDGSTVVTIRNDSPEKMQIVFSGPTPRFEELAPCQDCKKYIGEGPKTCPGKGPVGTYTIAPGAYDVVVRSVGSDVRPFTGNWALDGGSEYGNCFFVVQNPVKTPKAYSP